MWVAPNIQLKCPNYCLNPDPTKDISSYGQLGGGHGSWYPHKECVTTHRPNEEVPKMDGAKDNYLYWIKRKRSNFYSNKFLFCRWTWRFIIGGGRRQKPLTLQQWESLGLEPGCNSL